MVIIFDGIKLELDDRLSGKFPVSYNYNTFPAHYCGAGEGLGEKLVPDYVFWWARFLRWVGLDFSIKLTPACWIHDKDWILADPTWDDFHLRNNRFHRNLEAIIEAKARNELIKAKALYRPVTYMNAVNIHGRGVFWTLKHVQGHEIPTDAVRYIDIEKKHIIKLKHRAGELKI